MLEEQVGSVDFKPVLGYYGVLRIETSSSFSGVAFAFLDIGVKVENSDWANLCVLVRVIVSSA